MKQTLVQFRNNVAQRSEESRAIMIVVYNIYLQ